LDALPTTTHRPADLLPRAQRGLRDEIARDWNVKDPASGHVGDVLRFEVETEFLRQFPPRRVGGAGIDELWISAEQLDEFNDHIVGAITLIATYCGNDESVG
jgi:hypothetical protein